MRRALEIWTLPKWGGNLYRKVKSFQRNKRVLSFNMEGKDKDKDKKSSLSLADASEEKGYRNVTVADLALKNGR